MRLDTKLNKLKGVGEVLEKKLAKLKLFTAKDLLLHFPFRYETFSHVSSFDLLEDGMSVVLKAKIELIGAKRSHRKRMMVTEAIITDGSLQMKVIWFGVAYVSKSLEAGDEVIFTGKIEKDAFGLVLKNPSFEKVALIPSTPSTSSGASLQSGSRASLQSSSGASIHSSLVQIMPMYPLTAGITQKQMRNLIRQVLSSAGDLIDWIPKHILEKIKLLEYSETLEKLHTPKDWDELRAAEKRMKFEELFLLQIRSEILRQSLSKQEAPELSFQKEAIQKFVKNLPFELTKDQKISAWQVLQDTEKTFPMNRLLEGDVGSGKTVVAALCLYNTILSGYQAAVMAPTEVLAKQHFESFINFFKKYDISIALIVQSEYLLHGKELKEKSKAGRKRLVLELLKNGEIDLVIGTHAVLSEKVFFEKLGLIIVDEQHRFGVKQRQTLKEKSLSKELAPHFLSMTATPIPRSFALTMYGELDISFIKTMPKGRKTIISRLVEANKRREAYDFLEKEIKKGRQAFVICPLIEENPEKKGASFDTQEKKTVLAEYEKLQKKIFPHLKVSYLHGKMKAKEKEEIMKDFSEGKSDILVSTSVVEVGVNVPNASVMMIENAERFGLAQLHQFRGRVGRSEHQSYCLLFTESRTKKTLDRLNIFTSTTDGFTLAEYDLEQRGPGDVYGTVQSGVFPLKFASLQDTELIAKAQEFARGFDFKKYPEALDAVKHWEDLVHLE